jgi:hypothetical protein
MSDYEFNYKVWLIVSQVLTVIGGICFVILVAARFSLTINELVAAYFQGQTAFMNAGRAARKAKLDEVLPKNPVKEKPAEEPSVTQQLWDGMQRVQAERGKRTQDQADKESKMLKHSIMP